MDARHARSWTAIVTGLGMVLGSVARGDVYYEVGPGQTYATIQAAVNATPWNAGVGTPQPTFTESHIINVHAGTYNETVETDFSSHLNGQLSRTSLTNRLVIQANPGDRVVVNTASNWNIRESNVTIEGLKFTGISANPNGYYITLGTGGVGPGSRQRGNVIIYNNEFQGARGLKNSYNDVEPGVTFSWAYVNNYEHDFESHYENPGTSLLKNLTAGNLYARWGSLGGDSILRPDQSAGYDKHYYINNTLVTLTGGLTGGARVSAGNGANLVFANNVVYYGGPTATRAGLYFDAPCTDSQWPTMAKNIEDGANLIWARTGTNYATLASWQAYLALHGGADTGSYDGDPLFDNLAGGSYRLAFNSPGINAADTSYYTAAIADLGIGNLLGYRNYSTDPGLQFGVPVNIGAMIPEPGTLALLGLAGLCACRRSHRLPRADALHHG